ncbi:Uncharacterised protein [Klebsiella pneumoniae]|nr:Uncharacterised protein [Klebsiella pneumoniae]
MLMVKEIATGVSRKNSRLFGTFMSSAECSLLPNLLPMKPANT